MPQLPKGNKLDYAPDSIIQASKRISTISLEQMKNPLFDPDQPTLSALDAERNLDNNMAELGRRILDIKTIFTQGRNLASELSGEQTQFVRTLEDNYDYFRNRLYEELGRTRGEGRPKGSKNKPKSPLALPAPESPDFPPIPVRRGRRPRSSPIPPEMLSRQALFGQNVLSAEPVERYGRVPLIEYGNRIESTGQVADPDDEDPIEEIDTDQFFRSFDREPPEPSDASVAEPDPVPLITREEPNKALSNLLVELTKKIRDADILLVSKIKPALQKLSSDQLQTLTEFYKTLTDGWTDFSAGLKIGSTKVAVLNEVRRTLQYGDQIITLLKQELDKLRMDLLIVVNSYKQNEAIAPPLYMPSGDEWRINPNLRELVETGERLDSAGVQMEGSGRRHAEGAKPLGIPSIWNASVRNCPVKYLL